MKAERIDIDPAFNLFKPEGRRDMEDAQVITKVWLTNGMEYDVIPGTFHFYTTKGDRPQPFVQFQAYLSHNVMIEAKESENRLNLYKNVEWRIHTIEVFPASVAGIAYLTPEDSNE